MFMALSSTLSVAVRHLHRGSYFAGYVLLCTTQSSTLAIRPSDVSDPGVSFLGNVITTIRTETSEDQL